MSNRPNFRPAGTPRPDGPLDQAGRPRRLAARHRDPHPTETGTRGRTAVVDPAPISRAPSIRRRSRLARRRRTAILNTGAGLDDLDVANAYATHQLDALLDETTAAIADEVTAFTEEDADRVLEALR